MASQSKRPRLDDSFSLGGHTGGVVPEGSQPAAAHVLKKKQPGANGEREEGFLQAVRTHPFLCRCVVRYVETRQESTGQQVLVLENLCAGMGMPAVLDLKMGTRTYGDDATPEKVLEQTAKMMSSTTGTLGIRVVGARVPCERGGFTIEGSKYKNEPADEHGMRLFMRRFFRSPELLQQARIVLADLGVLPSDIEHVLCKVPPGWQGDLWLKEYWFATQSEFIFYGSSLLFTYDATLEQPQLRVKMIDFAHVTAGTGRQDEGYLAGLRSLQRCLAPSLPVSS